MIIIIKKYFYYKSKSFSIGKETPQIENEISSEQNINEDILRVISVLK